MSRPFEHPAHVLVPFALAVWAIMREAGTREERARCWEELDRHPRAVALGWIRDLVAANRVQPPTEEMEWWERHPRTSDN
jgi:hypothetical protein